MARFTKSSAVLFKNNKKASDKAPDYNGSIEMDEEFVRWVVGQFKAGNSVVKAELGGWLRDGKSGKFISMALSTPYEKATQSAQKAQDDIPF